MMAVPKLTILIPCLNEAETLASVIGQAREFAQRSGISHEILVADNGSEDGSQDIAASLGAQVVPVAQRGYGAALIGGIHAAQGEYVIMGDADGSYDFSHLECFLNALNEGADLVIGNRFMGGISPGAMPFLHRYLGNPLLSHIGRLFFHIPVGDFHCGLRAFRRDRILDLNLCTPGMEFASEMIVKAGLNQLDIREVPTILKKDGRSHPPHLHTWQDGWRHLKFLLMFSPRWLFIYPGVVMLLLGLSGSIALFPAPVQLAVGVTLDIHTFYLACMTILIGLQSISFGILAQQHGVREGIIPASAMTRRVLGLFSLEHVLLLSLVLLAGGFTVFANVLMEWQATHFGPIQYTFVMRRLVLSITAIFAGLQLAFSVFLAGVFEIRNMATGAEVHRQPELESTRVNPKTAINRR